MQHCGTLVVFNNFKFREKNSAENATQQIPAMIEEPEDQWKVVD